MAANRDDERPPVGTAVESYAIGALDGGGLEEYLGRSGCPVILDGDADDTSKVGVRSIEKLAERRSTAGDGGLVRKARPRKSDSAHPDPRPAKRGASAAEEGIALPDRHLLGRGDPIDATIGAIRDEEVAAPEDEAGRVDLSRESYEALKGRATGVDPPDPLG